MLYLRTDFDRSHFQELIGKRQWDPERINDTLKWRQSDCFLVAYLSCLHHNGVENFQILVAKYIEKQVAPQESTTE